MTKQKRLAICFSLNPCKYETNKMQKEIVTPHEVLLNLAGGKSPLVKR